MEDRARELTAAIVGCGEIAHNHVAALNAAEGVRICAVVDRDRRRAREVAALAGGTAVYTDLGEMLAEVRPDVVHVLTPPQTHAALAIQAMNAGAHVLVEKPMALSVAEADEMLAAADANGVTLATVHNYIFKPSVARALELVRRGAIGEVVDVTTFYGASDERGSYAGEAVGGHWAWRLPGGLFTNFIPHTIYLLQAFLGDVTVRGAAFGAHRDQDGVASELSALLDGERGSGTMTVSLATKPYIKSVEIHGTRGIVHADLVREVCTVQRTRRAPGMVAKVLFNLDTVWQLLTGTIFSVMQVGLGRWKSMPGLRVLIADLYDSIRRGTPPPVSGEDGRRVVEVMEQVWGHLPSEAEAPQAPTPEEIRAPATVVEETLTAAGSLPTTALVTGASGFLGRNLVNALWRSGVEVTALVRDTARLPYEISSRARVVVGDLTDPASLGDAMDGIDTVFHCAAVTTDKVPWTAHEEVNVEGTRAVLDAAEAHDVRRVVHVSSVIVYGTQPAVDGSGVAEGATYGPPEAWAHYMRSKTEAERIALSFADRGGLEVTVVRPGILYGPGRPVRAGAAQLGGARLVAGWGRNRLPYTYVGNVVDALLLAATSPSAPGEAFNVVDDAQVNLRSLLRVAGAPAVILPIPGALLERLAQRMESRSEESPTAKPPGVTRHIVAQWTGDLLFDTSKARQKLEWRPEVSLAEGVRRAGIR